MKKVILTRLVALLMMALVPLLSPAVNSIIYNATYDFSNLTLGTDTLGGVTYTTVNYDGMFNGGEPGKPSLPVDYIKFSVPYNATNFTVTATLQNNMISNLSSYLVYPCQPARMMNDTTPIVVTPPDNSVYNSSSYYPSQNAWVVDEGFLAGENHIVTVAVMPLSYKHRVMGNITTHQLRKSGTVRLVLSYELSDTPAMYPIIREDTTLRQEGYALTRSMVANPDNVLFNAPTDINMTPLDPNSLNPGDGLNGGVGDPNPPSPDDPFDPNPFEIHDYPYLIVTTSNLVHSLRRLAALKRQKGYEVKIVTIDEVRNDPHAYEGDIIKKSDGTYYVAYGDSAGSLRQYLKNAYKYWGTKYVLLAGSSIPYRQHDCDLINDCHGDFYYCEINHDWRDSSEIEREPELFVGRLLCDQPEQIKYYTDKLFKYELNPGLGDCSYLSNALFTEGRDYLESFNSIRSQLSSFFPNQVIIRDSIAENGNYPKGRDIIDSINTNQFGFMSSLNHGNPSCITTYGRDSNYKRYFLWAIDSVKVLYDIIDTLEINNGLNRIQNSSFPMVYYSLSCQTMPYHKIDGVDVDINFGESFTMGKDYGGPAYLGYTTQTVEVSSKQQMIQFINHLKRNNCQLGKAEALSKRDNYSGNRSSLAINHNLLGDPALEIWTYLPSLYNNIVIERGNHNITITRINKQNSNVVCYSNDGKIVSQKSGISGITINNVSPNSSVMVFSYNRIPYIAPLSLQNIAINHSQYVIASDVMAGRAIDSNRETGNVIISDGVDYEIEASGTVTLMDGFIVEMGSSFAVYPGCY